MPFWKIAVRLRRDRARAARPGRLRAQVRAEVRDLGRDRVARLPRAGGRCTAGIRSRSGIAAARTRSGPASTSCSHRSSAGRRSSPTTPASRARGATGFSSAGVGYFLPTVPLFALGAVIALSRHISDAPGLLTAVAAGGAASLLALLALTVDESDEAFANVYSGAVSLQNLIPRVPQRMLVGGVAAIATVGALVDRPAQLPAVPLPARLVLRAALRGAARRLAARRAPLQPRRRLPRARDPARDGRRLAGRLLRLPVALPAGPVVVDEPRRAHAPARAAVGRRVAAELPGRRSGSPPLARAARRGGPYWRARDRADREPLARPPARAPPHGSAAAPTTVRARCSGCACRRASSRAAPSSDRDALLPPLVRLGTPVRFVARRVDRHVRVLLQRRPPRRCAIDALGDTWGADRHPAAPLERAGRTWRRSRATSSRPRRSPRSRAAAASPTTARGSCGCRRSGRCELDDDFDRDLLRHIWVLKLAEEEAEVIGDIRALGVREVVVTQRLAGRDRPRRRARARRSRPGRSPATRPAPATRSRPRTSSRATRASRRPARRGGRRPSSRRC